MFRFLLPTWLPPHLKYRCYCHVPQSLFTFHCNCFGHRVFLSLIESSLSLSLIIKLSSGTSYKLSDNNSGKITSSVRNVFRSMIALCLQHGQVLNRLLTGWRNSLVVKENKGPFFIVRRDYEWGHDTQHLSKYLSPQLHSSLTSVTCESSVMCLETKDVLMTEISVIHLPRLKRNDGNLRYPSPMC
jgi:hypothetical protein